MRKIVLIVLGLFVVFTAVSQVFSFTGTVVKMMDADIMTIRDDRGIEFVIHLKGVDCPDSGQAFYNDAREMVESYCKDKKLTVLCDSSDLYGRTFAEVKLPDGRSLSKELLRFGYAWHYKRYNKEPEMAQIESDARTMRSRVVSTDSRPRQPRTASTAISDTAMSSSSSVKPASPRALRSSSLMADWY